MSGPCLTAVLNFCRGHGRKGHVVFCIVKYAVVVLGGHSQAFGGTNGGAQAAETAFGQVYVELSGIQALGHAVARFAQGGGRFDGFYLNTVHGANFGAFVAYDAVVDFIVELVAATRGYGKLFVRVLQRHRAWGLLKVPGVFYADGHAAFAAQGAPKVSPGAP